MGQGKDVNAAGESVTGIEEAQYARLQFHPPPPPGGGCLHFLLPQHAIRLRMSLLRDLLTYIIMQEFNI